MNNNRITANNLRQYPDMWAKYRLPSMVELACHNNRLIGLKETRPDEATFVVVDGNSTTWGR